MMMRKFTFADDRVGRTDFMMMYNAFRSVPAEKVTAEERQSLAAAQRVLEAISEPIGDPASDADDYTVDLRMRKLTRESTIEVSQKLHAKMLEWLDGAKFHSGLSMQVEDCRDRWDAAEKFEQEPSKAGSIRVAGIIGKRNGR